MQCGGKHTCRQQAGLCKVVDYWIDVSTRNVIESMYGLIQDWDTSLVTSMSAAFGNNKLYFNAPFGKLGLHYRCHH